MKQSKARTFNEYLLIGNLSARAGVPNVGYRYP